MAVNKADIGAQLTAKIVAVNEVLSTVGSLQNATPVVLKTVLAVVQDAIAPFDAAISAYDEDIDTTSVGGVVVGVPAPQLAAILLTQADDVASQGQLVAAEAFISRAAVNINNAPG